MFLPIPVLLLTTQMLLPVADRVPDVDVSPSCRAAAREASETRRDMESCMRQEHDARDQIDREWGNFAAGDRTSCITSSTTGGVPSYVEMLTCMEMARDARKLPSTNGTLSR